MTSRREDELGVPITAYSSSTEHLTSNQDFVPSQWSVAQRPKSLPPDVSTYEVQSLSGYTNRPLEYRPPHDKQFLLASTSQNANARQTIPTRTTRALNTFAIFIIILSTLLILASCIYLPFLWFLGSNNSMWHYLSSKNQLQTVIAAVSEVLKQSMFAQIGIASAMLAALVLEQVGTRLSEAPLVSSIRSSGNSSSAYSLVNLVFRRKLGSSWLFAFLTCNLALVLAATQAFTIILVSDLDLQTVRGFPFAANMPVSWYNVVWGAPEEVSGWQYQPQLFQAFGEYREPPFVLDGVLDTGVSLRAMLPFRSQQDRENLQQFEGLATVLDTRVTCQAPTLSRLSFDMQYPTDSHAESLLALNGTFEAPLDTPRLYRNAESLDDASFNCLIPFNKDPIMLIEEDTTQQWRTTLCELSSQHVSLISEFEQEGGLPHPTYLVFNVTATNISSSDWDGTSYPKQAVDAWFSDMQVRQRGEWTDLVFQDGLQILSVTLCYTTFRAGLVPVTMSSLHNRSETSPEFDLNRYIYTFDKVRSYYQSSGTDAVGSLQIAKQDSWTQQNITADIDEARNADAFNIPWTHLASEGMNIAMWRGADFTATSNLSGRAISETPSPYTIWFFQEILRNANIAVALQTLFTMMSQARFYEALGTFDFNSPVQRTDWVLATAPVFRRGLYAVLAITLVHLVLCSVVASIYIRRCQYSVKGDTWHTVAQLVSPDTQDILQNSIANDNEVDKCMGHGRGDTLARVAYSPELEKVALVIAGSGKRTSSYENPTVEEVPLQQYDQTENNKVRMPQRPAYASKTGGSVQVSPI